MIKIRDLTFEYFDRDDEGNLTEMVNAIRGINFDAGEGEFIVVAGVNGSGKSTFAKILNRLLLPIEGTVLIGGLDAMQEENIIPIRKMVGMVFQNPDDQLIGSVVEEDVAFGAENISVPHKELVKRVEDALAQVGLAASMRIEELSGGGKQKVAIAGVLAMEPEILILDEPTAGLDPKGRDEILGVIKKLNEEKETTIILVSHSMDDVAEYVDRIIVINDGDIMYDDTPVNIFQMVDELEAIDLAAPQITYILRDLNRMGLNVGTGIIRIDDAVQTIKKALSEYKNNMKG